MTTSYIIQDIKITRQETSEVQLLGCGVRIVLKDDRVRILSDEEWLRIVHIFPPRLIRLTRAFFASRNRRTCLPIVIWAC